MDGHYLSLYSSGVLADRIKAAGRMLSPCRVCPRQCKVDRLNGETGFCRTGNEALIASYGPHFGEEGPLVGVGGSGTIFISNCNLGCVFCQNYDISHLGAGMATGRGQLAAMMISLQKQGCHNINFVTPTHVAPQIMAALPAAIDNGLNVPLVYNSSGYDSVDTLRLLDGIFDIYMPDFKFWNRAAARRFAGAPDYPARAREAVSEMHRQVGDLTMDERGIAVRGLLVRHLVMPGGLSETREITGYLAREISPDTYVNIMEQYRPCGTARQYPPLDRALSREEYLDALAMAEDAGLHRLDAKDWSRFFLHCITGP